MDVLSPELAMVDDELAGRARELSATTPPVRRAPTPQLTFASRETPQRLRRPWLLLAVALTTLLLGLWIARLSSGYWPEGSRTPTTDPVAALPDVTAKPTSREQSSHHGEHASAGKHRPHIASGEPTPSATPTAASSSVASTPGSTSGPSTLPPTRKVATAPEAWIGWQADPDATLYNVVLVRNRRRIDFWPSSNSLTLTASNDPSTGAKHVSPGSYEWYVYAGVRRAGRVHFGALVAHGHAQVTAAVAPATHGP